MSTKLGGFLWAAEGEADEYYGVDGCVPAPPQSLERAAAARMGKEGRGRIRLTMKMWWDRRPW